MITCRDCIHYYEPRRECLLSTNAQVFSPDYGCKYGQRRENTCYERTCHDTGENEWHFVCSECGYEQNGYECWNYCPSCGAKVVEEQ